MTAKEQWDRYDMYMRCWRASRTNPGHPCYHMRRPVKPSVPRPKD